MTRERGEEGGEDMGAESFRGLSDLAGPGVSAAAPLGDVLPLGGLPVTAGGVTLGAGRGEVSVMATEEGRANSGVQQQIVVTSTLGRAGNARFLRQTDEWDAVQ